MKTVVVVALFAAVACLASGQTTNDNTQALVSSQEALEAIQSAVAPTGVMFTGELEQLEDPTTEDSDLASDGDFGKANTEGLVTNDQQEFFGHHRRRHHHRGRWGGWGSYGPYRFKFGCDGYGGWAYPLGYWNTFGAAALPAPKGDPFVIKGYRETLRSDIRETTETFPQYGTNERGIHYRLDNDAFIKVGAPDMVLIIVVFNNEDSWGETRSVEDFFQLIATFTHPKEQTSVTMLTSSKSEFDKIQRIMREKIPAYAQFSLLLRNDFNPDSSLTRENRHEDGVQNVRRRMLARYRNYAVVSTLESWHQHVVWLDADVYIVPSGLVSKMVHANLDILEPICMIRDGGRDREYDFNAWVGTRTQPKSAEERKGFVPNPLNVDRISTFAQRPEDYIALDSVGGTMLYVRADIHRQGVLFPHHYVIGSEWSMEGYDGIETEGLCYSAHFLGFRCWGMPHEVIHHYNKQ
ncbi:hypothetical protein Poli38472_013990 [Pythium oligandrum]|uniref:Glycosyltransferase family 62 protein n=1 Tax=Pythium oligandrum TaxID=41045 RepID=A0A8K1CPK3_PYTOL|nr:hypothetical protein Poli38472_013988 [Pythium oligandrum]TMW66678.1 hypothetical protein Poli38472_013990 [Pythium oligandrum]|eukprot:TMW66676.1 hypothetical protein Poli38472_013988 [Pythium oligandrum]